MLKLEAKTGDLQNFYDGWGGGGGGGGQAPLSLSIPHQNQPKLFSRKVHGYNATLCFVFQVCMKFT